MDTRPKLDKINLVIQYIYFFLFFIFLYPLSIQRWLLYYFFIVERTEVVSSTVNDPRLFLDGE
jgi:hypothetical protein